MASIAPPSLSFTLSQSLVSLPSPVLTDCLFRTPAMLNLCQGTRVNAGERGEQGERRGGERRVPVCIGAEGRRGGYIWG
ncbi:hypothetical protein BZA05DRAFT_398814 [Tricharina praecox]|uniref:uncharacterized protein n=1 Tax=Tricharina praecox TaxID=43433 RepID=UPI00221EE3A9|nr:uncharacterized protein BZA05DRAFT_398814 [Tricharina praecox]KAI5850826.1 hypothetical protein BZA05DRAFT_398814 [Tricharina praecox]